MLDDSQDPTPLLKEIRDDKTATIIIDANATMSHSILERALELGMLSVYYTYIFTSLLSSALLFDAVHTVVAAVQELNRSQNVGATQLSCKSSKIWEHGTSLMNYLRMVELEGLTGHIEFNSRGQRSNYALRIMQNTKDGLRQQEFSMLHHSQMLCRAYGAARSLLDTVLLVFTNEKISFIPRSQRVSNRLVDKAEHWQACGGYQGGFVDKSSSVAFVLVTSIIGQWHSEQGLSMEKRLPSLNVTDTLFNTTLIITTILENPYVMLKPNFQELEGNERYEGFCVDMLKELADILKFNYRIKLVSDGLYGVPGANGTWTGMVGELIARKADLAVAGLTITAEREKVIDFSKPFMTLGISIMYRVHLYSLGNSFWFPVGGFMQQGSTIAPRALSTRCVSGVWWAFTLIIISSYTANLAAFLTVQRMDVPIESVDDLADQTAIEYGTMHGGSTMTFFQNSRYQTYQRMWNFMHSKQPSVFVKSTEEGIARVLNSNYAYLLESTMNEYYRQRNCNLTQIGGLLDTKGYGIGMPLGSVYRDEFDLAILKLQEENRLEILKRKWWDGGKCPKEEDHRAKGGLGMENIGGIFVVLVCGLLIAIFMAVLEFVWMLRHTPGTEDSLQLRRRRSSGPSALRPHPFPAENRRSRPTGTTLSNGRLCTGTGLSEPLSHKLAQEAAIMARGCSHIRICPECRRFQGLRVHPPGTPRASPTHSDESFEWDKTTNSSEPE
ncbi:Glutamate receptor ionotropic, kainate 4 [Bagarius yarrelli]|uniref:Glutamate receptor ionotropic, kainate 4 n=1 Tax=Bagarius yarrelli TaxID=175774 RepID=A0A556V050_BAGYA|nr:Glutamate receptor ionotropic, kainate 4 [Bagarius yarrelli]